MENTNREIKDEERQKCEVYSRVVGYLRPVDQWNEGKKREFADRREYKVPDCSSCEGCC